MHRTKTIATLAAASSATLLASATAASATSPFPERSSFGRGIDIARIDGELAR